MISFLLSIPQYIRFVLLVIYVGCIVALSLLPPQDLPHIELFYGADKLIHLSMYLIFSMLACWTLKAEENNGRILWIILITAGWGIFMEFMQLEMHAGRSFSWYDEMANAVGVLTGISIYLLSTNKSLK
jgi:VanZ family protein